MLSSVVTAPVLGTSCGGVTCDKPGTHLEEATAFLEGTPWCCVDEDRTVSDSRAPSEAGLCSA